MAGLPCFRSHSIAIALLWANISLLLRLLWDCLLGIVRLYGQYEYKEENKPDGNVGSVDAITSCFSVCIHVSRYVVDVFLLTDVFFD